MLLLVRFVFATVSVSDLRIIEVVSVVCSRDVVVVAWIMWAPWFVPLHWHTQMASFAKILLSDVSCVRIVHTILKLHL